MFYLQASLTLAAFDTCPIRAERRIARDGAFLELVWVVTPFSGIVYADFILLDWIVSFMDRDRILVGCIVILLCGILLAKEQWFLKNTRKGQRLISWFGQNRAPQVLRALILGGMLFGALLASGIIRPIQWK